MRKFSFHFPFLFLFHSSLSNCGEMNARAGGEREIYQHFLRIFSYLVFLSVCSQLITSVLCCPSVQTPPKQNIFFFLISLHKATPEHQGEPCVQPALCGLSAVTRDHLETVTQANKVTRLEMCIGTKRVQTRDSKSHKFFLKVRFILTLLDKTKRPRMSHLYSYPRETIRLYAGAKLHDNNC